MEVEYNENKVEIEKEDGEKVNKRKRRKGKKRVDEEMSVGIEFTDSEDECEERVLEFRRNRGFKRRGERNRGRDIQGEKFRDVRQRRRRFCHFWNNGGCKYKDSECWFLHRESPECRYGKECRMRRCMFYHPRKENWFSSQGNQNVDYNYRECWYPSQGKQGIDYDRGENWYSKQHVSHACRDMSCREKGLNNQTDGSMMQNNEGSVKSVEDISARWYGSGDRLLECMKRFGI